jgi:hypothetical protein
MMKEPPHSKLSPLLDFERTEYTFGFSFDQANQYSPALKIESSSELKNRPQTNGIFRTYDQAPTIH